jgi:hypothetical protein
MGIAITNNAEACGSQSTFNAFLIKRKHERGKTWNIL